uniref:Maternal Vg1 n=1 Tax=Paracentrotus lividus TaxID=7656 RepID=Q8MQU1_PARLI|nr:maternal Vg1 [Paracentrotus lividus]
MFLSHTCNNPIINVFNDKCINPWRHVVNATSRFAIFSEFNSKKSSRTQKYYNDVGDTSWVFFHFYFLLQSVLKLFSNKNFFPQLSLNFFLRLCPITMSTVPEQQNIVCGVVKNIIKIPMFTFPLSQKNLCKKFLCNLIGKNRMCAIRLELMLLSFFSLAQLNSLYMYDTKIKLNKNMNELQYTCSKAVKTSSQIVKFYLSKLLGNNDDQASLYSVKYPRDCMKSVSLLTSGKGYAVFQSGFFNKNCSPNILFSAESDSTHPIGNPQQLWACFITYFGYYLDYSVKTGGGLVSKLRGGLRAGVGVKGFMCSIDNALTQFSINLQMVKSRELYSVEKVLIMIPKWTLFFF